MSSDSSLFKICAYCGLEALGKLFTFSKWNHNVEDLEIKTIIAIRAKQRGKKGKGRRQELEGGGAEGGLELKPQVEANTAIFGRRTFDRSALSRIVVVDRLSNICESECARL